ncbi:MAG: hypothetical protein NY202_01590 [Mollicutes bacterium UO1]
MKKYYEKNHIESIGYKEDKLYITFNNGDTALAEKFSNRHDKQKLEQLKIYLKSSNKQKLTYSELNGNSSINTNKGSDISDEIIILLIVAMVAAVSFFSWLIWRRKKNRQN